MKKPRVGIVAGFGINADLELAQAFELAGAEGEITPISEIFERPQLLDQWSILSFPGGFSFGDHFGSGKVLSHQIKARIGENIRAFIDRGGLVLGVCNGFQTLVKMGLLPNTNQDMEPSVSLIHNDSGQFLNRWVRLEVNTKNSSPWLSELRVENGPLEYPIRHGEGKFIFGSEIIRRELTNNQRIAFRYGDNPNGSVDNVAGITDGTGQVLGLMPHPEAFLYAQQHPRWTREGVEEPTAGLRLFQGAVKSLR